MGRVPGDTQNTAAILEGDTHITRDLGTGVPKTRGYPNHCADCEERKVSILANLYKRKKAIRSILFVIVVRK